MANLWDNDEPVLSLGIDVPRWIEQDITPCDVAAICSGGWMTTTTKKRINEACYAIGLRIVLYQENGKWYVQLGNIAPTVPFYDGMVLTQAFGSENAVVVP